VGHAEPQGLRPYQPGRPAPRLRRLARYASAKQLHRLFFGGVSKKQTYRRLAKLCEPGGQPGEGPCLRRLGYGRRDGTEVPVWALAPLGRSIASRQVPWLRPPAASDIGHRFLEHTLLLNEVLVMLVAMLRRGPQEPLCDLLFRWLCEDDEVLTYRVLHAQTGRWLAAVIKPDAVLTIPARKRRIHEVGGRSPALRPRPTGAAGRRRRGTSPRPTDRGAGQEFSWIRCGKRRVWYPLGIHKREGQRRGRDPSRFGSDPGLVAGGV